MGLSQTPWALVRDGPAEQIPTMLVQLGHPTAFPIARPGLAFQSTCCISREVTEHTAGLTQARLEHGVRHLVLLPLAGFELGARGEGTAHLPLPQLATWGQGSVMQHHAPTGEGRRQGICPLGTT